MSLSALAAVPLLASLVLSYRAGPGTVYVAADSRLTTVENGTSPIQPEIPDDTACKLRVLDDGILFAGTGNAVFTANGLATDIYRVAANAAATLPRRPLQPADIRRVALAWQATVHARLQARMRRSSRGYTADPATGTTGSFYAATADGSVYAITLRIAPGSDGRLENIEEPQAPSGYLVAAGAAEAKRTALAIAASQPSPTDPWPNRLQSIENQSIRAEIRRHGNQSDIGGAVDLVEITPKGPTWLARKPGCSSP